MEKTHYPGPSSVDVGRRVAGGSSDADRLSQPRPNIARGRNWTWKQVRCSDTEPDTLAGQENHCTEKMLGDRDSTFPAKQQSEPGVDRMGEPKGEKAAGQRSQGREDKVQRTRMGESDHGRERVLRVL